MADSTEALHDTLAHLHEQLESAESLDDELRDELRQAMQEIRETLDAGAHPASEGLIDRIEALTQRFEGSHPQLSEVVGRVVDALARLGI